MCTAVASQANDAQDTASMKAVGLVDAHAYSLLAAKVVTLDKGGKVNLVKVRNPWGKREWSGDWSDKSPKWTENTKRQVDFKDADDGTFWISIQDYYKFFYITTVCY